MSPYSLHDNSARERLPLGGLAATHSTEVAMLQIPIKCCSLDNVEIHHHPHILMLNVMAVEYKRALKCAEFHKNLCRSPIRKIHGIGLERLP
jgi:hypothetical protein